MDALRRVLATIQKNLGSLTPAHKLTVGLVVVIAVLTLAIVALVGGRASLVEVAAGGTPQDRQRAQSHLESLGIETTLDDTGKLMVRREDAARANSSLVRSNIIAGDKATYFENLLQRQSWMNPRQVNQQQFQIALQNELARMVMDIHGVEKATVQIDAPEPQGLGNSVRKPKATVMLASEDGRALSQGVVDAAARLVAGSIAGLTLENVTVTDAAGGNRTVTTDTSAAPGIAMEHAARIEHQMTVKLTEQLSYIRGVKIAVTASVDVKRSTAQVQSYLPPKQGTVSLEKKTVGSTVNTTESMDAATPGPEANQTADITRAGGGGGARSETSEETSEYENRFGSRTETIVDPKGQPTSVAVSVTVPDGYVHTLLRDAGATGTDAAATPDAKAVDAKFESDVKPKVVGMVLPHLRAMVADSYKDMKPDDLRKMLTDSISVTLVPGEVAGPGTQVAGLVGGGDGVLGLSGGLVDKAVLGALALIAMLMMFFMVKKAGKRPETPSAEELVGLPPTLETVGEVIGEADETETAMAGIEVGEDQIEAQKRLEQVGELVASNPEAASKLMGRWINVED